MSIPFPVSRKREALTPSFPNSCFSSCNHSPVHSLDPSLHLPSHSFRPQGFLALCQRHTGYAEYLSNALQDLKNVPEFDQPVSLDFHGIHYTVCVLFRDTLPFPWWSLSGPVEPVGEESCSATKEKLFADLEQLIIPECIFV